jgi:nicotinamidase-related amidase
MVIEQPRTALVITDLQNDFLSPGGAAWGLVRDSLAANHPVENIEALLRAAREGGYPVFLSPLTLDGFGGSGADWPERFKPYLQACDTVVASPHKVYGTSSNDLVLQLRKRRMEKVILAGPAGNLCVEAHLRESAADPSH